MPAIISKQKALHRMLLALALCLGAAVAAGGVFAGAPVSVPPGEGVASPASAPGQVPPAAPFDCSMVSLLGIDKQTNFRAAELLTACRGKSSGPIQEPDRSKPGNPNTGGPGLSLPNISDIFSPLAYGGTDVNAVTGAETYPKVTQSESFVWSNGSTIVVNYNDSSQSPGCYAGISYSTNGGAGFTRILPSPLCSGHGTNYGDPTVIWNANLNRWYASDLATGCGGQGIGVWESADGINWVVGACAHNGTSDDRQSHWVDNNPASPFYGRQYISWNDFAAGQVIRVVRSDNGATWSAPVNLTAAFVRNVQMTGGPDGTVFVAGMDEGGGGFANRTNIMYSSTDGGVTWANVTMGAAFAPPGDILCPTNGYFVNVNPIWRHMGWGQPGVGPGGVVHYVYAADGPGADTGDILYTRSTDNGSTWSAPITLNTDGSGRAQWMPSLSVTSQGAVMASWYDRRNTTNNSYEWYGNASLNNGLSWQGDMAVSDVVIPQPLQPDSSVQSCYAGDYNYHSTFNDDVLMTWTDGRVLVSGNSQQDVFFDKQTLIIGTPTPTHTPCAPVPCTGTPTNTATHTRTPSNTPTITNTFTRTNTRTITPTRTRTRTRTPTITGTIFTNTPTLTRTPTRTFSPTLTLTPSITPVICTGSWTQRAVYPTPVYGNAVASQGGTVFSFGGLNDSGEVLANSYEYDPVTDAWTPIAPLPLARALAVAVSDGTYVYVLAGYDGSFFQTDTLYRYDPATDTYTTLAPSPLLTAELSAAYLNGKIYQIGGFTGDYSADVNIYDIVSNAWSPASPLPTGLIDSMAVALNGFVYVAGGFSPIGTENTTYRYNPITDVWDDAAVANMPSERAAAGTGVAYGRWIVAAGTGINNHTMIWDPITDTWSEVDPITFPVYLTQGAVVDNALYVVGGLDLSTFLSSTYNQRYFDICQATPTPTDTPTNTPTDTPTNTPTDTPTATATPDLLLRGHVTMQGRPAQPHPLQSVPITLTLKLQGGGPETNYSATTDAGGNFTVTVPGPGMYDWRVKNPQTLANSGTVECGMRNAECGMHSDSIPYSAFRIPHSALVEMGLLRAGDCNNDNCVNTVDFNILRNTFGKTAGDPGYDSRADFDGNNTVNVLDFNLLRGNFGFCGAPPIRPDER